MKKLIRRRSLLVLANIVSKRREDNVPAFQDFQHSVLEFAKFKVFGPLLNDVKRF